LKKEKAPLLQRNQREVRDAVPVSRGDKAENPDTVN